jgi:hypothetical protein
MSVRLRSIPLFILILIMFAGCGSNEGKKSIDVTEKKDNSVKQVLQKTASVCIWDRGTVRATPKKNGKYVSSMSLGEKINWLGETAVDSNDRNKMYYHVELSDGTTGWASQYVVAPDAKAGITTKEVPIYLRPDLLTLTNKSFNEMELVAITKSTGEWLEVTGKEGKKKGWIKSRLVSEKDADIAVGLLTSKALEVKDSSKQYERILEIVDNPSLASSRFMNDLKERVSHEQMALDIKDSE